MLTGALPDAAQLGPGDVRALLPRFSGANAAHNAALTATLIEVAHERGATPAQVALAWLHARSHVHGVTVVPIPGTRPAERLEENPGALAVQLTDEESARLDELAEQVAGDRYPDMRATSEHRETQLR